MLTPAPAEAATATSSTIRTAVAMPVAELLTQRAAAPAAASRRTAPRMTARQVAERRIRARIRVVAFARAQQGKPYSYGSAGPRGYDCSGLTSRSFRTVGINLPRTSGAQGRRGIRVTARQARPGDLVVWNGHVGVLSGRWRMVDAPGRGRHVVERAIYRSPRPTFRRLIG